MLKPSDVLSILRARHLPGLSLRQLQVLSATELGYSVDEIATGLGRAAATIRRHLSELEHHVFDTLPLTPSHCLLGKWTREHYQCCTRAGQLLIEMNQLFDRDDQPHEVG